MNIFVEEKYSVQLCREFPNKLFVFGDNTLRKGKAGQAIIRDEPNAFGIVTKLLPSMSEGSFLPNNGEGIELVRDDLRKLYRMSEHYSLVFPRAGIGTGLSRMKEECPIVFEAMNNILYRHFRFDNILGTIV